MGFDKQKFIAKFAVEAREHLKHLNDGILSLEKHPEDPDTLNSVFRLAHSIKGSSKMMKLTPISETAHKIEDVLDALRGKTIRQSGELLDILFEGLDAIELMLDKIASGQPLDAPSNHTLRKLEDAAGGCFSDKPSPESPAITDVPSLDDDSRDNLESNLQDAEGFSSGYECMAPEEDAENVSDTLRVNTQKLDGLIKLMGEIISANNRAKQRSGELKKIENLALNQMQLLARIEHQEGDFEDCLLELIDDAGNLYRQIKNYADAVKEDINIQNILSGKLRDRSLKLRMQPISTILDTFGRTIRNIAREAGKKVDFIVEGGDTELDKKIIEMIGDPLIQMIRNGIEHGIEAPDYRKKNGKPETGTIRFSAAYEGGNVRIVIQDDGRGIQLKKIREKALKNGLINEMEINAIPDSEMVKYIFHPGLSTSEIITDLSGRGVGMDVVKKNIMEDLKGSIRIDTREGQGTTFSILMPVTMAIIHIFLVKAAGYTFAIPANFIMEFIRIRESDLIEVTGKQAVRLREDIIPIENPAVILNLPVHPSARYQSDRDDMLVMIVSLGEDRLGLIIDTLIDEEDRVIKALPSHMKNLQWVSGFIISSKNEIFNVLHIPKIIDAAREKPSLATQQKKTEAQAKIRPHILVVDDSMSTREIEKSILESYGYQVTLAVDGMDGLEKAGNSSYDLVISDIEMPHLDGFALTETLRKEKAYRETPIILVTSRDKDEDKKRGILAGADAYIVKGAFDQTALIDSVQRLIGV